MDEIGLKYTNCDVWDRARTRDGYIRLRLGSRKDGTRRLVLAHRWVYELIHGPIPSGMEVHHLCHNRACTHPSHLILLSRKDHLVLSNKERKGTGYFKATRRRDKLGKFIK